MNRQKEDGSSVSPSTKISRLERRANLVRSRLLRTVDALDARRHEVVEMGETAKKVIVPAARSLIGIAAMVGLGAIVIGYMLRARAHRKLSYRMSRRISTGLASLDLVRKPSLGSRVVERVALTLVTFLTGEIARRAQLIFMRGLAASAQPRTKNLLMGGVAP